MFNKFHLTILNRLYTLRCIGGKHTSKENALRGFPKSDRGEGESAYQELVQRSYTIRKPTSYGEQVSLNVDRLSDIKKLLNPSDQVIIKDKPPLEDSLDPNYEQRPFHVTEGEKPIKGIRAKYSYHSNASEPSKIISYVVVEGEKKSKIELGSFNNPKSLLAKAVRGIDAKFGMNQFRKADMYSLGKDIVGNRQPVHAIVDMLLYYEYLERIGEKRFRRTKKQLPQPPLDNYQTTVSENSMPKMKSQKDAEEYEEEGS